MGEVFPRVSVGKPMRLAVLSRGFTDELRSPSATLPPANNPHFIARVKRAGMVGVSWLFGKDCRCDCATSQPDSSSTAARLVSTLFGTSEHLDHIIRRVKLPHRPPND